LSFNERQKVDFDNKNSKNGSEDTALGEESGLKQIDPLRFLSRKLSGLKDSSNQKRKIMIQDKDTELKAFFQCMKEKDGEIPTPDFPEVARARTVNWWIPMGIAASLLLGFLLFPKQESIPKAPVDVIIITLQQGENQEQQILIEEKTYLETWESPTASLLAEY
jgi:hypothetical protein